MSESEKKKKTQKKGATREYIEAILFALAIALCLRYFVIEAFKIPSASMVPTLLVGDHIFVNKFAYGVRIPFTGKKIMRQRQPTTGEIVVFIYPHDRSKDFIKRVVGVPGDTVEIRNNQLFINSKAVTREFRSGFDYSDVNQGCMDSAMDLYDEMLSGTAHAVLADRNRYPSNYGPKTISNGELFVMGDNRDNSSDSRVWGTVPLDLVKGRALFIWLSIDGCALRVQGSERWKNLLGLRWIRFERLFTPLI